MTARRIEAIAIVVNRMPEWVRRDLAAKEESVRVRAEEALAAMLAATLSDAGEASGD